MFSWGLISGATAFVQGEASFYLVRVTAPAGIVLVASGVELEVESHKPAGIEVKLTKDDKGGAGDKTRWILDVFVPPNARRLFPPHCLRPVRASRQTRSPEAPRA